ncbi:MAG: M64 family metallopeptidase [Pirellulales bacterium]
MQKTLRTAVLALLATTLVRLAAAAAGDYVTLFDHGPASNRWDITIMGDGYTAAQQNRFHQHADKWAAALFATEPYHRYLNFFNIQRIDVVSQQSGADIPPEGVFRNTALGASYYWGGGSDRLLSVDDAKVQAVMDQTYAGLSRIKDSAVVSVNHTRYGGAGGRYAVFAGGNGSANEIALHEMGHALYGLADEYGGDPGVYPYSEPSEPNVTKDPTGAKWAQWIGYDEPGVGPIGAYEGGRYYDQGIYRPSEDSKMRDLNRPFDAVSREEMILDLYRKVDPLDGWTPNDDALLNPTSISVDLIDPAVLDVDWLLDGAPISLTNEQVFKPADFPLALGLHTLSARAYDPTEWVRIHRNLLEETVTWSFRLESLLPGDANGDHTVDLADFGVLEQNFSVGTTWTEGDFDASGKVDLADFGLLKENFGRSGAAPVPEPAAWLLAFIGATAAFGLRPCVLRLACEPRASGADFSSPGKQRPRLPRLLLSGYFGHPMSFRTGGYRINFRTHPAQLLTAFIKPGDSGRRARSSVVRAADS